MWEEWCSKCSTCLEGKYYDSDDSCLYTGKPCDEFASPVSKETIVEIMDYLSTFNMDFFSITIDEESRTVKVNARIGRYEELAAIFNFDGKLIAETVYD